MTKKFLIGIVAAAAMVSCVKRTEVEPVNDDFGSATVKGQIYVSTNYINDTVNGNGSTPWYLDYTWENGDLQGLQVRMEYDRDDLTNNNYQGDNDMINVFATVDANGMYTADIPTPKGGEMEVNVWFPEVIQLDITDSINGGTNTEMHTYRADFVPNNIDYAGDDNDPIMVADGQTYVIEDNFYWED